MSTNGHHSFHDILSIDTGLSGEKRHSKPKQSVWCELTTHSHTLLGSLSADWHEAGKGPDPKEVKEQLVKSSLDDEMEDYWAAKNAAK